jgi:hypothetical protein
MSANRPVRLITRHGGSGQSRCAWCASAPGHRAQFFAVAMSHAGPPHLDISIPRARGKTRVLFHVFRRAQGCGLLKMRVSVATMQPPALEEMIARLHHIFSFITGRTSTAPSTSKIAQPLESSTACSRSRASISV